MYARVARFEDGEADAIRAAAEEIDRRSAEGPPEGVPGVGFNLLIDPDNGRALAIALFASEEDMRKGDEALDGMDPPGGGMGRRASVEFYEVATERRL